MHRWHDRSLFAQVVSKIIILLARILLDSRTCVWSTYRTSNVLVDMHSKLAELFFFASSLTLDFSFWLLIMIKGEISIFSSTFEKCSLMLIMSTSSLVRRKRLRRRFRLRLRSFIDARVRIHLISLTDQLRSERTARIDARFVVIHSMFLYYS